MRYIDNIIMSKFKQYYDDPEYKQRHLEQKKEEIECGGCGAIITRQSYAQHCKSERHKKNSIKNENVIQLEKELKEIERVHNKKIRAMERKKNQELEKLDIRIKNINVK